MAPANNGKPPGFFGILGATSQVLSRNLKHFLYLSALLLLVPFALFSPFQPTQRQNTQTIAAFLAKASILVNATASHTQAVQQPRQHLHTLPLLLSFGMALFFVLVATPPLTVSVCRAYLNKDLCFKSSLQAVPDAVARVFLTLLCVIAAFTGIVILISIVACIVSAVMIMLLRVADPTFVMFLMSFLGIVVALYFIVLWSLAPTVTILEQKYGLEALSRSAYLVNGRKRVGLRLRAFFHLCFLFVPFPIFEQAPMPVRFCVAALSVVLWSVLYLNNVASTVVFYFSCKDYHNESTETLPTTAQYSIAHSSSTYTKLNSPSVESLFTIVEA